MTEQGLYEVPVMVRSRVPLDSQEAVTLLAQHVDELPCKECALLDVEPVPADPEDPNSPPVPATPLPWNAGPHLVDEPWGNEPGAEDLASFQATESELDYLSARDDAEGRND